MFNGSSSDKGVEKGVEGDNSSTVRIVTALIKMVGEVVQWLPWGPTHVTKAYNNQLIYCATGISHYNYNILVWLLLLFMAYLDTTNQRIVASNHSPMWWSYLQCRALVVTTAVHIYIVYVPPRSSYARFGMSPISESMVMIQTRGPWLGGM